MGTIVVGALLICIVSGIIGSMVRRKKNGKFLSCGGGCKGCKGHCCH